MNPNPQADGEHISEEEIENLKASHGGYLEPKVKAGAEAGSLAVVLVFVAARLGLDIPPEVASALTVLIGSVAAWWR